MTKKRQPTKTLQEKLKEKPSYKEATKIVEEFLKSQEKVQKKESIKINPYAEHPWVALPELFSSRWDSR